MKIILMFLIIALFFIIPLNGFEPHFMFDPAISPDGKQVCFVYQEDLWLVPFQGGNAKRLTSTEANESNPGFSCSGEWIAFNSNREGQNWIYIIPATGGEAKAIFKEGFTFCDWFSDDKAILCAKYDLNYRIALYKMPLDGKRPELITEVGDFSAVLSPDNNKILFHRYGDAYREAYTGSLNGDLWEYDITNRKYIKLTDTPFTERYPRYSYNSNSIFFCASDGDKYQLFRIENYDFSRKIQLTSFSIWSARDLSIARENDRIVFECFDEIWTYDPTKLGSPVTKITIDIKEDFGFNPNRDEKVVNAYDEFAISDDDLLVAFSYKYDLFVQPRKGGDVRQISFTHNGIEKIAFLPDNRTIVYSSYTNGYKSLYKVKVDSVFIITPISWYGSGKFQVDSFYRSSDYHWVIEYSDSTGSGRIAIADSLFNNISPFVTDKVVSSNVAFSPDGNMAVYVVTRPQYNLKDFYIYNSKTKEHTKGFTDDAWLGYLLWTSDQKSIIYNRNDKIQRLDLLPRDEYELDIDNWKEIFTTDKQDTTNIKNSKKIKENNNKLKFAEIQWFQLDKRSYPILSDTERIYPVLAIDDTSFYYIKVPKGENQRNSIHKVDIYGKYSTEIAILSPTWGYHFVKNRILYYKDGSVLKGLNLKSKTKIELNNSFSYKYNTLTLNINVFEQAWGVFGANFYDPKMHGKDWNKLYDLYHPYLKYAFSPSILEAIIEEMIGDINSSHTGYYPRNERARKEINIAQIGVEFDYSYPQDKGILVKKVYQASRLSDYYKIKEGDILIEIDGVPITNYTPIDSLLNDKIGKKINMTFQRKDKLIKTTMKGLTWATHRNLWYQDKISRNRNLVDSLSHNRIGYMHIPAMGNNDYTEFVNNIFKHNADKSALIIDIRGNSGGHIHNELLTFLSKKPNAYNTSRTFGEEKRETPSRTWTKPLILIIDENSFSDGEIFPQLFKEAKLGTVIGTPTSGAVIGTWQVNLLDGSSMRMPGSGWYRLDGTKMEGNGVQPDIRIDLTPNDIINNNDTQLIKAIQVLMEILGK